VVNDSTYQKLGDILRGSPRGVAVVMDELVGLLETVEAKGQEGARAFYLAAWNGDQTHRIDRIGRGSIVIDRLSLCVLGGIQPGKLKNYVGQAMRGGNSDDGLMQRFQLLVWPDVSAEWIDVDRYYDQQAFDDVMATFTRIRDLKPGDVNARTDLFGGPAYLQFDAPAQARFNGARLGFERSVRSGMCHPALEAHFSKYPRMIAALALVIHLVDGGNGPVGVVATNKSIGWAKYLTKHAQRAYGAADNAAAQSAKALADRIEQGDVESGFTARSIVRKGWQHLSSNDVPAALEWLIDANWIVAEDRSTAGRPTKVYIINPKVGGKQ
jgi:putative DNA primase/helicase